MPDISIANLPAFLGSATDPTDLLVFVDVKDTTESPLGTTKRLTFQQLLQGGYTGTVIINGVLFATPHLVVSAPIGAFARVDWEAGTPPNAALRWFLGTDGTPETAGPTDTAGCNLQLMPTDNSGTGQGVMALFYRDPSKEIYFYRDLRLTSSTGARQIIIDAPATYQCQINFLTAGQSSWMMGRGVADGSNDFIIYNNAGAGAYSMRISAASNIATFPGGVTLATLVSSQPITSAPTINSHASAIALATGALVALGSLYGLLYLAEPATGSICLAAYGFASGVATWSILWQTGSATFSTIPGTANTINLIGSSTAVGIQIHNLLGRPITQLLAWNLIAG